MPEETSCIHCGTVGFIRSERVITGEKTAVEFRCQHCNHSWRIDDRRSRQSDRRQEPKTDSRVD